MKKELQFWGWFINHKNEYANLDNFDIDERENNSI